MEKLKTYIRSVPLEAYIWFFSLTILALIDINEGSHFTICPLSGLGFEFCPGCGLGKSIHHLINLNFSDSFQAHPLGAAAFLILLHRIILLTLRGRQQVKSQTS